MSNTELIDLLTHQLQEALSVIREQAHILAMYGIETVAEGITEKRREAVLQDGQNAVYAATEGRNTYES